MKRVTKQMLMATVILSLMIGMNVYGQRLENKNDLQSLGTILNEDGTINTQSGVSGSFDPAGYAMTTNEKGEPVFVPTGGSGSPFTEGNEDWDDQFGDVGGINGEVRALATNGNGLIYVGGLFTSIDNNPTYKYFAVWNGITNTWSTLGSAVFDNYVEEILYHNGNVYVGGAFHTINGNTNFCHIAKWNGSAWEALGRGVDENVTALTVDNSGSLYVGGNFIYAKNATVGDDVYSNYVAKWNGTTWSALRKGFNAPVNVLVANGSEIYAGGYFTEADNTPLESTTPVKGIAKWNGTSWTSLGYGNNNGITGGPYPQVRAILLNGNDIYVGGQFTSAGTTAANSIAKFNTTNSTWYAIGSGIMNGSESGIVNNFQIISNKLFIAGSFTLAGGYNCPNYVMYDLILNYYWNHNYNIDGSINETIYALNIPSQNIFFAGNFQNAGNHYSKYMACYLSGFTDSKYPVWQKGKGAVYSISAIAVRGSNVYVGGGFYRIGSLNASNIACWNGSYWTALSSGVNGYVTAIAINSTGYVYVGGSFTNAGGNNITGLAVWDGGMSTWSMLGSGLNGYVDDIAISGSDVYVGGSFSVAGGITVNHIAKWNGTTWSALGSGTNGQVFAVAVIGTNVYVGGNFTRAGGTNVNYIAKYQNNDWQSMRSGTNGIVRTFAVSGTNLYVGGEFTQAGGYTVNHIAKYDGTYWSSVGTGTNNSVESIAIVGSDVYVGGNFTQAGGIDANYIAKWNGTTWSTLGSGTNSFVRAITPNSSTLYVGGCFTTAGGKQSRFFGRYAINAAPVVANPIPDYSRARGFEPFVAANLANVFTDANNDLLSYTVVTDGKTAATIQGTSLIVNYINYDPGTSIDYSSCITVTANDGEYSVQDVFIVCVQGDVWEKTGSDHSDKPTHFELSQNYPNPFNPTTTIKYALKEDVKVSLKIYNSLGQEVRTLVNEDQTSGFKEIMWDGKNNQGSAVPSGMYMYRLVAGSKFVKANKMMLMK